MSALLMMLLILSLPKLATFGILANSLVKGILSAPSQSYTPSKSVRT